MGLGRLAVGVGAVAIVACGAVSEEVPSNSVDASVFPATDFQSGSRLRAQTYRTSEGASIFHGWFDSKLSTPCAFARAEDGVLRCLPTASEYEVWFADATCGAPAVLIDHNVVDAGPRYARLTSCAGTRVFLGSDAPVAHLATAYSMWSGTCSPVVDDFPTYAIVEHSDASAFVAGTWVTKEVDDTVAARVLVADDGARATMSAYDVAHAADCDLGDPTTNSGAICAPLTPAWPDSACADGAVAFACSNALPSALTVQSGCAAAATTTIPLAQSCFPGDHATVMAGEGFDAPHLAQADQGTGRLRVRWVTSASGKPIRAAGLYDSLLHMPCHPQGYGMLRCVPDASNLSAPQTIGGCYDPNLEVAIIANACVTPRYTWMKGRYYVRGAPLEVGAKLCVAGEVCACSTYDGSGTAYHSTPIADAVFEPVVDVTE